MSSSSAQPGLFADTLAALGAPKRLVPILLVSAPLVVAQHSFSRDSLALPVGVLMCAGFVLIAPYLWRRWRPLGDFSSQQTQTQTQTQLQNWLGLLGYGVTGLLVVGLLGLGVPWALDLGPMFLTGRESLSVALALFWVGGWGLGRDIDLERNLERERERGDALAREAERAQLLALRSHLDPHFLFNTLNAIAEWCREDGVVAEAAILRLSTMLRTILAGVQLAEWPLAREIDLCRDVFELHRIRDPGRLSSKIVIDDGALGLMLPPMVLLPAIENAIKHGPAAGHVGEVELRVREADAGVVITVQNPGRFVGRRPGGEGVPMIERRLELAYEGRADLQIVAQGETTLLTIELPTRSPLGAA
ncbi:MAG TPA: sensor histidine kinase [Nannocystis exedens]|nr:sensor histidine kinase [Nannocystis exedens]